MARYHPPNPGSGHAGSAPVRKTRRIGKITTGEPAGYLYEIQVCTDCIGFHYYVRIRDCSTRTADFFADYGFNTDCYPRTYDEVPADLCEKGTPMYIQRAEDPVAFRLRVKRFNRRFGGPDEPLPYQLSSHNCRTYVYAFLEEFVYEDHAPVVTKMLAWFKLAVDAGGPIGLPAGWLCGCFEIDLGCNICWYTMRRMWCGERRRQVEEGDDEPQ